MSTSGLLLARRPAKLVALADELDARLRDRRVHLSRELVERLVCDVVAERARCDRTTLREALTAYAVEDCARLADQLVAYLLRGPGRPDGLDGGRR